jgi:hypothetical protein
VIDQLDIDLGRVTPGGQGYIKAIQGATLPKRLALTANCYHCDGLDSQSSYKFTFILDVLLVPLSLKVDKCFNLYEDAFTGSNREPPNWYMGTRRLQDDIILLRRLAVQGEYWSCAATQCDIPEDVRNRDYRLVVTCPVIHYDTRATWHGLLCQLEMEY